MFIYYIEPVWQEQNLTSCHTFFRVLAQRAPHSTVHVLCVCVCVCVCVSMQTKCYIAHVIFFICFVWCVVWMHGNMFSVIRGDLSIICSGKTLCEIFCRFWLWAYTTGHCVDITCVSASKWLCLNLCSWGA